MNKELVLAGILLSVSTVLKLFSIITLCHISFTVQEIEHPHHEQQIIIKKEHHYTHQPR